MDKQPDISDRYRIDLPIRATATPLRRASQYTDAETGFVYLRARYYDPATGQFLTRDPIEAVTRSAYGYVGGNPLNYTDPLGLAPWDVVTDAVEDVGGAIFGGAKAVGHGAKAVGRGAAKVGTEVVNVVDTAMDVYDLANGRWRRAVVGYVGGIAVTVTCAGGVIVATGGIGAPGTFACVSAGAVAGEFLAGRVQENERIQKRRAERDC